MNNFKKIATLHEYQVAIFNQPKLTPYGLVYPGF